MLTMVRCRKQMSLDVCESAWGHLYDRMLVNLTDSVNSVLVLHAAVWNPQFHHIPGSGIASLRISSSNYFQSSHVVWFFSPGPAPNTKTHRCSTQASPSTRAAALTPSLKSVASPRPRHLGRKAGFWLVGWWLLLINHWLIDVCFVGWFLLCTHLFYKKRIDVYNFWVWIFFSWFLLHWRGCWMERLSLWWMSFLCNDSEPFLKVHRVTTIAGTEPFWFTIHIVVEDFKKSLSCSSYFVDPPSLVACHLELVPALCLFFPGLLSTRLGRIGCD